MAEKDEAVKCKRWSKDRLSNLPDDIRIRILSCVPIQSAIASGSLSQRWRGLWTNLTSIDINSSKFHYDVPDIDYVPNFLATIDDIVKQITLPSIHSVSINIVDRGCLYSCYQPSVDNCLRQICDRNVRKLKVTFPAGDLNFDRLVLPSFIFQTQSLVSLNLWSEYCWRSPVNSCSINLPKLKKLSLTIDPFACEWLEKLINACPSLEKLVFMIGQNFYTRCCIKVSNQKLRRLIIYLGRTRRSQVVIAAPKLEHLTFSARKSGTFCFDDEPILLREIYIDVGAAYSGLGVLSGRPTLSKFALRKITRLTVRMKNIYSINTVFAFQELCPMLDNLWLIYRDISNEDKDHKESLIHAKFGCVSISQRVLKEIKIKTYMYEYGAAIKFLLELVEYLLDNSTDLEHLYFKVAGSKDDRRLEHMLCEEISSYSVISKCCAVEFVGRVFKMSRKVQP